VAERGGLTSSGSEYGPVAGSCGHGNEASDSMKRNKFLVHVTVQKRQNVITRPKSNRFRKFQSSSAKPNFMEIRSVV